MATVKVNIEGDASGLEAATRKGAAALGGLTNAQNQGKSATNALKGSWTELQSVLNVSGQVIRAVGQAYDGTVGAVVDYNKSILDASRATRMGVEDLSRFIQVGDDMGVSMDSITRSLQLATKNGFAPSIESLANLADKANAMASPTERAAMLAKIMGRNWAELDPILQLGGQRIRELAAAQQDGLVATEREIAETEKFRLAMDQLNDAKQAFLNTTGLAVVTAINRENEAVALARAQVEAGTIAWWKMDAAQRQFSRALAEGRALEDIAAIKDALEGIDGTRVSTTIDVYEIRHEGFAPTNYYEGSTHQRQVQAAAVAAKNARGEAAYGMAIGGLATPGLHLVGEEGPELIRTDNRGNINVLRASVTRALSKGAAMMAHALDIGGGGGTSKKPLPPGGWKSGIAPSYTGGTFNLTGSMKGDGSAGSWGGGSSASQQTQATAAQAVAEAAASAIPAAVAQGTRVQTEAAQRIASDNAKANAANARTLAQIRDILLMQGGAKDIGREVGKANQLLDSRF